MGYEVLYLTALEVRPERVRDMERILELRERAIGEEGTREGFAALLQKELPHLKEAFTPEGVGAVLNSDDPYLDKDGFLTLGAVYNGGGVAEALFLSHFLVKGEVIVLSDDEELLYGYRVVEEGKVEPLQGALVDGSGRVVWSG
ncbi:hypothetical protein [Thermus caldilimi]|uniref:hypothetical protein n=1 Tax=Thermus caldilimi TaxID=2483360 RepID=UPI001076B8CB|nr:hypothetical protein [Thermus caldilimi]